MAGQRPQNGPIEMLNVTFVAPGIGERPVDRLFRFGDFGMVFGEPEHMMGRPTRIEGPPANWDQMTTHKGLTGGSDNGIFEKVRKARKEK